VKVRWTENARQQLREIREYIARDSRVYARQMVDRVTARSKKIGKMPLWGAVVP
jgi:plasmid stabilization system protein ParE